MIWTRNRPEKEDVPYFYRGSGKVSDPRGLRIIIIPSHMEERCFTMSLFPPKKTSYGWGARTRWLNRMQGEFSSVPIPVPEERGFV